MSLGNFQMGSKVRLPLQVLENGGLPVSSSRVESVEVNRIIKPDLSFDSNYPKDMISADEANAIYYLDYEPEEEGNYIVVYNITINEIVFSQMDSFFISSKSSSGGITMTERTSIPTAVPV